MHRAFSAYRRTSGSQLKGGVNLTSAARLHVSKGRELTMLANLFNMAKGFGAMNPLAGPKMLCVTIPQTCMGYA
jgi:hypothetical protein